MPVAFSGALDRRAVADDDDREMVDGRRMSSPPAAHRLRDGRDRLGVLLVVVVRQTLDPQGRDRAVDALTDANVAGSR